MPPKKTEEEKRKTNNDRLARWRKRVGTNPNTCHNESSSQPQFLPSILPSSSQIDIESASISRPLAGDRQTLQRLHRSNSISKQHALVLQPSLAASQLLQDHLSFSNDSESTQTSNTSSQTLLNLENTNLPINRRFRLSLLNR